MHRLSARRYAVVLLLGGCSEFALREEPPPPVPVERCNGLDDDGDGLVDEDFRDTDEDGLADCLDVETCDGIDNDGDALVDEDFPDNDGDGIANCLDAEECDGVDNDGDGDTDEDFDDNDYDGIANCVDVEECDGIDNDGDGWVDEGMPDSDGDGRPDCRDHEACDGLDNDGNGLVDEDFPDTDGDGVADCVDVEDCDGIDNDGDGQTDEDFSDVDLDGIADCVDTEECDGVDNDGDGDVDEGMPDTDGDGVLDCFEDECMLSLGSGATVPLAAECATESSTGALWDDIFVMWHWTGAADAPNLDQAVSAPVVGRTTDTNGDGVIDETDVPMVFFTVHDDAPAGSADDARLVALRGDTGVEEWSVPGIREGGVLTIARPDADATPIILAPGRDAAGTDHALAFDGDGNQLWSSPPTTRVYGYPGPTVADIDADGTPEVMVTDFVLDIATGAVEATIDTHGPFWYGLALPRVGAEPGRIVGVGAARIYLEDGTYLGGPPGSGTDFPALVQADPDPEPDILFYNWSHLYKVSEDGTTEAHVDLPMIRGSAPCVADFDGDGVVETVISSGGDVRLLELDGSSVWSVHHQDDTTMAGCSAYDLDRDGRHEVLFAGEEAFVILDGATGATLFEDTLHQSWTGIEYPVAADLDGDGSVEIVIVESNTHDLTGRTGVVAYTKGAGDWTAHEGGWPTHAWSDWNVKADGTVVQSPPPMTQGTSRTRAGPHWNVGRADLSVEIVDGCSDGCWHDNAVRLAVRVANRGNRATVGDVPVSVFAVDGMEEALLDTMLVGALAPGEVAPDFAFTLLVGDLPTGDVLVRVGDPGVGVTPMECDPTDNAEAWTFADCW